MKWIKEGNWLNDPKDPEYIKFTSRWPKYIEEAEVLSKHGLL